MFFRDDGDGEVLAEDRAPGVVGSYLDLRFPASDIPQIARSLYLRNSWRLIADNRAQSVPLLHRMLSPPDLTYSTLRSVSPVHLQYPENMNVRETLKNSLSPARWGEGIYSALPWVIVAPGATKTGWPLHLRNTLSVTEGEA